MKTVTQNVIKLERADTDKGPWLKVHVMTDKGEKVTNIFDQAVIAMYTSPGQYEAQIEKGDKYWTVKHARLMSGGSQTNGHVHSPSNSRLIQAQCAVKVAGVVGAAYAQSGTSQDAVIGLMDGVSEWAFNKISDLAG